MIAIIVGTTAELIKMAPVHHELSSRGHAVELWFSGQHVHALESTLSDLALPAPAVWLVPQKGASDLARPAQVPLWMARFAATVWRSRRRLRDRLSSDGKPPVVLVHGDTFTAPLGAMVGRFLKARVGHVEAGLRSGSLLHPFPEELNRRVAARLVHLHFAPTQVEAANLRKRRGTVVVTGANTVVDAVEFALGRAAARPSDLPDTYGVATLHRFEFVRDEALYRQALEVLKEYGETCPIAYFAGASERERLHAYGLLDIFDDSRLVLRERLAYVDFLPVLARAEFVVTDSGGIQEECHHLGIPCAVHRMHTERLANEDGATMVLTRYDVDVLRGFLQSHDRYRRSRSSGADRPSAIVADALEAAIQSAPAGPRPLR